jgi:superfamily I DNA/RNA helicase
MELALKAVAPNGRVIMCGDPNQALYGFVGADTDNFDRLIKRLDAKVLTLPITYRCPTKVVKHAQQFVPDIEARPDAPEGTLEYISFKDMMKKAKPGCFILSRVNAPLIGLALKFIGNSVPCNIQGRDIGANLITIIKKSRRKTIPTFLSWLEKWERKEIARVTKMNRSPVPIRDKAQCLRTLADACASVGEMKSKIQDLFEDGDDTSRIILSTVHRAKGLERDVVFVLNGTFFGGNKEERNIKYVSYTRAKSELYLVTGGNYGLKKRKKKSATKSK